MNAPTLADKHGTPARPTRGLLDTTLDSQNKDRRLAIVGAWLAFMIGLAADGTVDSPASFGVAGTVGAVIVALGFAAASRCRLLPQRSHKHRVRLVFLSIAVGGAVGLINLAANWAITEADPALRALLVERIMAKEPWEVLVTGPLTEEVVFRLFVMSVMAWLVYRNAKRERLAFAIVLVGSAVIFAVPHLERPLPDASMLADYYLAALMVKYTLLGVPLGWVFWRWGLPHAIICHSGANATHMALQWRVF
jgi:membrane protease YdiL (CAAX protease family)